MNLPIPEDILVQRVLDALPVEFAASRFEDVPARIRSMLTALNATRQAVKVQAEAREATRVLAAEAQTRQAQHLASMMAERDVWQKKALELEGTIRAQGNSAAAAGADIVNTYNATIAALQAEHSTDRARLANLQLRYERLCVRLGDALTQESK